MVYYILLLSLQCIIAFLKVMSSYRKPQLEQRAEENHEESQSRKKCLKHSGYWTPLQHGQYISFLEANLIRFNHLKKKPKTILFQEMSVFVGTRSAMQCRTHHQKYLNKYEKIQGIIRTYKKSFQEAEGNESPEVNLSGNSEERIFQAEEPAARIKNDGLHEKLECGIQASDQDFKYCQWFLNNNIGDKQQELWVWVYFPQQYL